MGEGEGKKGKKRRGSLIEGQKGKRLSVAGRRVSVGGGGGERKGKRGSLMEGEKGFKRSSVAGRRVSVGVEGGEGRERKGSVGGEGVKEISPLVSEDETEIRVCFFVCFVFVFGNVVVFGYDILLM